MFKFLHAADVHLDSPLKGLDKYEGAPVEEIRNATRRALENLVTLAVSAKVAFLVLAGDLYDGDWKDYNTGLFFISQMVRLKHAGIRVFVVTGNHDAANRMTKALQLPDNVYLFSTSKAETCRLDDLGVAIHGQSFAMQCTTADLAANYPPPENGYFNLGVLHTSLSGCEGHDNYAPCSIDCLRAKGYDYWALGHVHERVVISERPVIAYSGNLQGRHIREAGAKGCLLVTVGDDDDVDVAFQSLDVFRWRVATIDLSELAESDELMPAIVTELSAACETAEGLPLAVRVRLVGASAFWQEVQADRRQLVNEIRARAADVGAGSIWIEKIVFDVTPVRVSAPAGESADGPLHELAAYLNEARASTEVQSELTSELADLVRKLPPELAQTLQTSEADWWRDVLDEAEAQLMTRLTM